MKKVLMLVGLSILLVGCSPKKEVTTSSTTEMSTAESSKEKEYYFRINGASPEYIQGDSKIKLSGSGRPESTVTAHTDDNGKRANLSETKTDKEGNFEIIIDSPESVKPYYFKNDEKSLLIDMYSKSEFDKNEAQKELERKEIEQKAKLDAEKKESERKKQLEEQAKKDAEEAEAKKISDAKLAEEKRIADEKKAAEEAAKNRIANAPREHQNALQKAKDYLDYTSFSKSGLYDQLIHEKFPTDAAQFAIDVITVDWNAQALNKAKDYLDYSSFSDQGLYDQLIHEGFTFEQSQFALDNLPK